MPVDVSMYNRLNPPDPITGLGGTVGLANALTQNQILNARNQLTQGEVQGQGRRFGIGERTSGGRETIAGSGRQRRIHAPRRRPSVRIGRG